MNTERAKRACGEVILKATWCVGEFISFLEKKGLFENTLIVFSSDNGSVVKHDNNGKNDNGELYD
ncbi:MAG: sulfatase-like hydrolase/transferase [Thermodesulfobacteriota bacterium]